MDIHKRLSAAALEVFRQANHYTNCHGDRSIKGEDILLGLAVDQKGPLRVLMEKLHQSDEKLKGNKDKHTHPVPQEVEVEEKPRSPEVDRILRYAAAEAWYRSSYEIDPIDILLALLVDWESVPCSRLKALGIEDQLIRKEFPVKEKVNPDRLTPDERSRLEDLIALTGQEAGQIIRTVAICEGLLNRARGLTENVPAPRK